MKQNIFKHYRMPPAVTAVLNTIAGAFARAAKTEEEEEPNNGG